MPAAAAFGDTAWSAHNTTPDAIEAALRRLTAEKHAQDDGSVPARVLNMLVFVKREHRDEIAERLRGVGRYHASRTVIVSYDSRRERLSARVAVAVAGERRPGEPRLLREIVFVEIGERHLDDLPTIAGPLVISDLPTLLWLPHRHPAGAGALLELAQATLIDSTEEHGWSEAIERACALSEQVYVVDLAWLRSTPWRERVAALFDPADMRPALASLRRVEIRHHPDSTVTAILFVGWLASRLRWELDHARVERRDRHGALLTGEARSNDAGVELCLQAIPELEVPGLASLELQSRTGLELSLEGAPGGLRARERQRPADSVGKAAKAHRGSGGGGSSSGSRQPDDGERTWTLLGASRGEARILGEGIRQALLRDPTYTPALHAARAMLPQTPPK
jgi:glucose-6-phosphate dehydrogenase assembly protein OpcA